MYLAANQAVWVTTSKLTTMNSPSLILVSSQPLFLAHLHTVFASTSEFSIVAQTPLSPELIIPVVKFQPRVVILDIDGCILQYKSLITSVCRFTRVILLGNFVNQRLLDIAIECNINAVLDRSCSNSDLIAATWRVAIGCSFFSSRAQ